VNLEYVTIFIAAAAVVALLIRERKQRELFAAQSKLVVTLAQRIAELEESAE
jgi:hypothetical protein